MVMTRRAGRGIRRQDSRVSAPNVEFRTVEEMRRSVPIESSNPSERYISNFPLTTVLCVIVLKIYKKTETPRRSAATNAIQEALCRDESFTLSANKICYPQHSPPPLTCSTHYTSTRYSLPSSSSASLNRASENFTVLAGLSDASAGLGLLPRACCLRCPTGGRTLRLWPADTFLLQYARRPPCTVCRCPGA